MKLPLNFYKPLAVGAPAPMRELPLRAERVVHFFPPHLEKIRARLPDTARQVDVLCGNLEDAIPILKDAAKMTPDFPGLLEYLGKSYQDAGNAAEAERVFREGLRRFPNAAEFYYHLGAAHFQEGRRQRLSERAFLIEEFLAGEEASVMAVCDGKRFALLPPARDYKRALDEDGGPNTGGMGAVAPAPGVSAALESAIGRRIVEPVLAAMARRGAPFRGVLYCGLMIAAGEPYVLEFNARFGDPETQVVLPLLEGSLGRLLESAARIHRDRAKTLERKIEEVDSYLGFLVHYGG